MALRARLELALRQQWLKRGLWARLMWPLHRLMAALVRHRQQAYRLGQRPSVRLPVPVLVVGNVAVGGAGKTPATIAIVTHLLQAGWRPGVVSRGHGRRTDGTAELLPVGPDTDPTLCGDEPLLIHRRTGVPVWVGQQRAQAGKALLAHHPEVNCLVCDDGLQHLALQRDVEVVVFDERGIGNGWLLPAGLLREPWPQEAAPDTKPGKAPVNASAPPVRLVLHQQWQPAQPFGPGFVAQRRLSALAVGPGGQTCALSTWRPSGNAAPGAHPAPLMALAGIARPEVFFSMLAREGLALSREIALPDHADMGRWWPQIQAGCAPGSVVLCTEKDAVKLFGLPLAPHLSLWAVPLELAPEPGFFAALEAPLSSAHGHQTP